MSAIEVRDKRRGTVSLATAPRDSASRLTPGVAR